MSKKLFKLFALALLIAFVANLMAITNCLADDDDEFETPPIVDGPDCLSHNNLNLTDNNHSSIWEIILDWINTIFINN